MGWWKINGPTGQPLLRLLSATAPGSEPITKHQEEKKKKKEEWENPQSLQTEWLVKEFCVCVCVCVCACLPVLIYAESGPLQADFSIFKKCWMFPACGSYSKLILTPISPYILHLPYLTLFNTPLTLLPPPPADPPYLHAGASLQICSS